MGQEQETIFSKIISREIPADIVYETENVLAFRDIAPQAPHHILIIPKKFIRDISQVQEDDAHVVGEMVLVANKLAADLGVVEQGYRLVINTNDDGGQTVFHLHMHLLAGRAFAWPPG
ncbi:MAG: histidine triad nucleotide-binding protein [Bdellovibrionales bacterium]|nr:histidine triad nucleotide-binding protein [Bdellovibrionales bacterium]